jgi:hypothetical protein
MKSQQQLDKMIRTAAGKRAVEELVNETDRLQTYSLSDGSLLEVNKVTGDVRGVTETGRKITFNNPAA